jgi:hypothetical protein
MSLGGYGPVQYYHLIKTKALSLKPRIIIIGLYLGNDILDSYRLIYKKDYWRHFRRPGLFIEHETAVPDARRPDRIMGRLRHWLARHSVLYRMLAISFGDMTRFFDLKYASRRSDVDIAILDSDTVLTGLTPARRLRALDLRDSKVREGLRLTLELFGRMRDLCEEQRIGLLVVVIPTKERVFTEFLEKNSRLARSPLIDDLVRNERQVNRLMKTYFNEQRISYVDVLPELSGALPQRVPYPANQDGHPNAVGYEVIASAVDRFLRNSARQASSPNW